MEETIAQETKFVDEAILAGVSSTRVEVGVD